MADENKNKITTVRVDASDLKDISDEIVELVQGHKEKTESSIKAVEDKMAEMEKRMEAGDLSEQKDAIDRLREQVEELRHQFNRPGSPVGERRKSPGEQVVSSDEYKAWLKKSFGNGRFKFALDKGFFPTEEEKTTITSGTVGSSTPGILVPDRVVDFTPLPRRELTMRDLLPSRATTAGVIEFVRESTAPVASPQVEGSAKFETGQTFTIVSASVVTLAGWVPATNQILSDWPALRRIVNESLMFELRRLEDAQIISGDGSPSNLSGLTTLATAYAGTHDVAADNKMDKLRHALLELHAANERPDFLVLNPEDYHDIQLLKTEDSAVANTGAYLFGDPLGARIIVPTLWGLSLVISNALTSGKFLMGDSRRAEIFDRQEATIDISTEHSDYFVKNLVAIRAEERIALAVYRTTAFVFGTF